VFVGFWNQERFWTYDVTSGIFLLGDNATGTLGSVQGALALDDGLAGGGASSAELAADLGGGFPVRHFERRLDLVVEVLKLSIRVVESGRR
jgi:hypothetical protein